MKHFIPSHQEPLKGKSRRLLRVGHAFREVILITVLTFSIFLWVSLFTYHHSDNGWSHFSFSETNLNAAGEAGAWLSDFILYFFGYFAYLFPLMLIFAAWKFYRKTKEGLVGDMNFSRKAAMIFFTLKSIGFLLLLASGAAVIQFYLSQPLSPLPFSSGGVVGYFANSLLIPIFNKSGTILILFASLLIGMTLFTGISWYQLTESIGKVFFHFLRLLSGYLFRSFSSLLKREKEDENESVKGSLGSLPQPPETEIVQPVKPDVVKQEELLERKFKKTKKSQPLSIPYRSVGSGELPSLSLLNIIPVAKRVGYSEQQLKQKAEEVELRLLDFGIQAKVVNFYPGPVVTRFELELAAGTKVSKISALSKDLARSLSVNSVRIVEVIPGKSVIGLELPNPKRETVTIHEVLSSKAYKQSFSPLTLALGKDISGHAVVVDVAKMPHLLVAGTTGAGKSVGLNAMLLSMLYKATPKELRLILIDPKMLEFSVYADIPHLLTPVVTDMRDAGKILRWCVVEMERRYQLLAALSVRNINTYNNRVREAAKRGSPLLDPLWRVESGKEPPKLEELPQIVVFADEFADMMVTVGKKVETLIARLAQKARAAGIHLILATQRPSVDVITGLIKANIATRIAYQVSSKIDSRTILDQRGAEQLLGYGDMLYLPPGSGLPVRVHGAYVADDEVHRVIEFLKKTGKPEYLNEIFDEAVIESSTDPYVNPNGFSQNDEDGEKDPLYDQAVEMVTRSRRVSTSSIQRNFKIGYNRAARIVEAMEASRVVSSMESNGIRTVLAPPLPAEES